jgi:hypothetical protein
VVLCGKLWVPVETHAGQVLLVAVKRIVNLYVNVNSTVVLP